VGTKARVLAPAIVTRIVPQRERADCAIASMAMFAGASYEDVLREVVLADPKNHGRVGLSDHQIRKVMTALGVPVRHRAKVDYEEDYGLLRLHDHMCILRNGMIVENDTLWDVDVWRVQRGYTVPGAVCGIFVAAE
jgi:ABC-type bacteriocin/lantibiotic exporter with double-glycine peptidase domain